MSYDQLFVAPTTSAMIEIFLRDAATGQGRRDVLTNHVTCYYIREGAAANVEVGIQGAALGEYTNRGLPGTGGGWAEVDADNQPGLYQFSIPDAALAAGANAVTLFFRVDYCLDKVVRIVLVAADLRDANALGLQSLENLDQPISEVVDGVAVVVENVAGVERLVREVITQVDDVARDMPLALTEEHGAGSWKTAVLEPQAIRDAMKLAPSEGDPAAGSVDALLEDLPTADTIFDGIKAAHGAGSYQRDAGPGLVSWTYLLTEKNTGGPVADALVWMTTDAAGTEFIAATRTNAAGVATFYPDLPTGTDVYLWRHKTGWGFENPDKEKI